MSSLRLCLWKWMGSPHIVRNTWSIFEQVVKVMDLGCGDGFQALMILTEPICGPSCTRWLTWVITRTRGQYFWRPWTQKWLPVVRRCPSSTKTVSVQSRPHTEPPGLQMTACISVRHICADLGSLFPHRWCDVVLENVWSKNKELKLLWTYLHTYIL